MKHVRANDSLFPRDSFDYILDSENIAQILSRNFNYRLSTDPIENSLPMVEMSSQDAFSFSLIQGASFLVNEAGLSIKDRLEVFIHRGIFQNNKYIYSPGLFGRDYFGYLTPGNSPREMFKKYPVLKSGIKKLIFRSVTGNNHNTVERRTYFELLKSGLNPEEYFLFKISDTLSNMEPFFEYLSCKKLDEQGYFSESQTPWFQQSYQGLTGGIPDFSAFYISEFDILSKKQLLPNFMVIQNLSTLFIWKNNHTTINEDYTFSLGEVKFSKANTNTAINQLEKYAKVNLAEKLYISIYDESSVSGRFGLIHINDDFILDVIEPKQILNTNPNLQKNDHKWIADYAKIYLLANLDFSDISDFIIEKLNTAVPKSKKKLLSFDLLTAINKSDFNEIVDLITSKGI